MDKIWNVVKDQFPPGAQFEWKIEPNEERDRKVQENLARWQSGTNPLAPLTNRELDLLYQMREVLHEKYYSPVTKEKCNKPATDKIDTLKDFVERVVTVERDIIDEKCYEQNAHRDYLQMQTDTCVELCVEAGTVFQTMEKLEDTYRHVTIKTGSLHQQSNHLMQQQSLMKEKKQEIQNRLKYFTLYYNLSESIPKLLAGSTSVNSEKFVQVLDQLNDCTNYLAEHSEYKESYKYELRYEELVAKCLSRVDTVFYNIMNDATNQVMNMDLKSNIFVVENARGEPNVETAFSFYYGKFQNASTKISRVINCIEDKLGTTNPYLRLMREILHKYFLLRGYVMKAAVNKALVDLSEKYRTDHSILFRSAGLFITKVCLDEIACYHYFFKYTYQQLGDYLYSLCQALYDILRPRLITINHMEVLSELCTILKEMINDQVQNNDDLKCFVEIIKQLLHDVQERLVFRMNIFFQHDLIAYEPSPGDLAYPEKLEQMENIAEELIERRTDSRASSISIESQEVANINAGTVGQFRSYTGNSPADLHGMWYPTVKYTLVALSRLYLCLDRRIFQGVAQEGLIICVRTIETAAEKISTRKSVLDGKLFQIKHLLIVREQIAPFQVDFTIKEMSLDFSHMKDAATGLIHNRGKIFSFSSNNAILEFLLEGTPRVKQYLIDSRKEIDKQLKISCENFIANTTNMLIGNLLQWIQKAEHVQKLADTYKENAVPLREQEFTKPQILAGIISLAQRNIKTKIPEIQKSMRLYLANRETEFILFRPIKNNIMTAFIQLDQILLAAKYTTEDQLLIACPSPEQLNVLICSVSLTAEQDQQALHRSMSRFSDKSKV